MNFSPYGWRAGDGYLPPPGSMAVPICPQPGYSPYGYYPSYPSMYPGWPAGPVVAMPPPKSAPKSEAPPAPPAPPKKKEEPKKEEPKKEELKKEEPKKPSDAKTTVHSLAPSAAPTVRPGVNYMYAPTHTKLHIFNKAAPIWEAKYKSQALAFKIFKVSTQFTVQEVIERVLRKKPEEGVKWAITEVIEVGGGEWMKGTTIEYGSDKAKGTLASMGWNEKKGSGDVPPVWLVVHKI